MNVLIEAAQIAAGRLADSLKGDGPFLPFVMAIASDGIHVLAVDSGEGEEAVTVDQFDDAVFDFLVSIGVQAAAVLDSGDRLVVDPDDELVSRRVSKMPLVRHPNSQEVVVIEASDGLHAVRAQALVGRSNGKIKLGEWETYLTNGGGYYPGFVGAAIKEVRSKPSGV